LVNSRATIKEKSADKVTPLMTSTLSEAIKSTRSRYATDKLKVSFFFFFVCSRDEWSEAMNFKHSLT
jgi:hypothetical protein